jgi:hypothetical protein
MTPYTSTILAEEHAKVYRTLKVALFCAKRQARHCHINFRQAG